ncbi:MAG: anti-sigma factor [Solirubrobacteraceae bacterium]|jgi:anti-sigma factor RsiW
MSIPGRLHGLRFRRDHRWVPAHASAYLDGDLAEHDRRRVKRHSGECAECRALLSSLRVLIGALRGAGAQAPAQPVAGAVLASIRGRLDEVPRDRP